MQPKIHDAQKTRLGEWRIPASQIVEKLCILTLHFHLSLQLFWFLRWDGAINNKSKVSFRRDVSLKLFF